MCLFNLSLNLLCQFANVDSQLCNFTFERRLFIFVLNQRNTLCFIVRQHRVQAE